MINIGILEDNKTEAQITKLMITKNLEKNTEAKFIDYDVNGFENVEDLIHQIFADTLDGIIHGLILDESMIMNCGDLHGSFIYEKLNGEMSRFPLIILTNFDDQAIENLHVDPDKVYKKREFYLISDDKSMNLCKNFIRNIERFLEITENLKIKISSLENDLIKSDFNNEDLISEIYLQENELSNYLPVYENNYGSRLQKVNINEVLDLIEKVDGLLNGEDI